MSQIDKEIYTSMDGVYEQPITDCNHDDYIAAETTSHIDQSSAMNRKHRLLRKIGLRVLAFITILGLSVSVILFAILKCKKVVDEKPMQDYLFEPGYEDVTVSWYFATNGYSYRLFLEERTYWNARASCKNKQARLASTGLRNSTIGEEIYNHMPSRVQDRWSWWIGLIQDEVTGNWSWSDGIPANFHGLQFMHALSDPLNINKCAAMIDINTVAEEWCQYTIPYLCEKDR